ncbi:MAG TPA: hypothetical protein ENG87_05715 [Candidatus Pacearchaeota archaeon]|nr:hypothetical protein BMS3Abin17_00507 [archaeon BMS3Abin17]HDK42854.1 hypothetical protein [Candidatus Pacearchaeota archaeon]HDZ61120.1 hypothetical protein [Candidatus Pacearchaeota archaeon]
MKTKTIKNVDDETWRNLKMLSAKNNVKLGVLLKLMIKEFEKDNKKFWNSLLNNERLLSEGEAKDMLVLSSNLRKERGFRE